MFNHTAALTTTLIMPGKEFTKLEDYAYTKGAFINEVIVNILIDFLSKVDKETLKDHTKDIEISNKIL